LDDVGDLVLDLLGDRPRRGVDLDRPGDRGLEIGVEAGLRSQDADDGKQNEANDREVGHAKRGEAVH